MDPRVSIMSSSEEMARGLGPVGGRPRLAGGGPDPEEEMPAALGAGREWPSFCRYDPACETKVERTTMPQRPSRHATIQSESWLPSTLLSSA